MEESIQFAKKYLEDLLSFFGLNIEVYATTEDNEVIELSIPSTHMNGFLIGQRGATVRSFQYIVSSALRNKGYDITRVNVDVADYKKARAERLAEKSKKWVDKVKGTDKELELEPMTPADRRIIHKVASEEGLETESVGEGRDRRVILKPGAVSGDNKADTDAPEPKEPETEAGVLESEEDSQVDQE